MKKKGIIIGIIIACIAVVAAVAGVSSNQGDYMKLRNNSGLGQKITLVDSRTGYSSMKHPGIAYYSYLDNGALYIIDSNDGDPVSEDTSLTVKIGRNKNATPYRCVAKIGYNDPVYDINDTGSIVAAYNAKVLIDRQETDGNRYVYVFMN